VGLNGELVQVAVTSQPTATPPRFPQPFHWDCTNVKQVEASIPPALKSLGLLGTGVTVPAKGKSAKVKFLKARASLQALLKTMDANLRLDNYPPVYGAIPATLTAIKSVKTTGKALANNVSPPANRRKLISQLVAFDGVARPVPASLEPFSTVYLGR
jgi:hypothetical protein